MSQYLSICEDYYGINSAVSVGVALTGEASGWLGWFGWFGCLFPFIL